MDNHHTEEHLGQLKSDIPGGTDKDTEHFGQVMTTPCEEDNELDDDCDSIPRLLWEGEEGIVWEGGGEDGEDGTNWEGGGEEGRDCKGPGEEGRDWEGADDVDMLILFGGGTGLVVEVLILFWETEDDAGFSVVFVPNDALCLLSYISIAEQ